MDDPLISSAEYNSSTQLGISGEKEGPYDWVPPNYWYDTTHVDKKDSSRPTRAAPGVTTASRARATRSRRRTP